MRNLVSPTLIVALTAGASLAAPPRPSSSQSAPAPSSSSSSSRSPFTPKGTSTMPEFALLFRLTRTLPPDEIARRAAAVRDWAIALRGKGTIRDAILFEDAGYAIAADRSAAPMVADRAVAGVTIIQAADLDAALAIAKIFPGLPFGTTVELRALKPLPAPPPAPSPAR
jgi:hypothetical protein